LGFIYSLIIDEKEKKNLGTMAITLYPQIYNTTRFIQELITIYRNLNEKKRFNKRN